MSGAEGDEALQSVEVGDLHDSPRSGRSPWVRRAHWRQVLTTGFVPWAASLALSAITIALLLWASPPDFSWRAFAFNTATDVAGAVAFALLLSPFFFKIRRFFKDVDDRREARNFSDFPYEVFRHRLHAAGDLIRIMETSSNVLDAHLTRDAHVRDVRQACVDELRKALERGRMVEILLLDPRSEAAHQRARELAGRATADVARGVQANLRLLHRMRADLDPGRRDNLQVRLYSSTPRFAYYRVDDKTLIAFFAPGHASDEGEHLDFPLRSAYGRIVNQYFQEVLRDAVDFLDYLYCRVAVNTGDGVAKLDQVAFVKRDDHLYLGMPAGSAGSSKLLNASGVVVVKTQGRDPVRCEVLDKSTSEDMPQFAGYFREKYGTEFEYFVMLGRPVPVRVPVAPQDLDAGVNLQS